MQCLCENSERCRKSFPGTQLVGQGLAPKRAKDIFSVICEELSITHISVLVENPESLDILVDEAHDAGVSLFVWKQLLHRIGMDNRTPQHLINLDLETIDEPWICPNNTEATSAILEELHSTLENHDVDGLFIDVFRYPSPYYGLKSVLSCFCDSCNTKAEEIGIDWGETREGIKKSVKKISRLIMEEVVGLKDSFSRSKLFQYVSQNHSLSDFFRFRHHSIISFVSEIRRIVEEYGRKLGLDTFTPSLSWLVGRDYCLLRDHCD